MERLTKNGNSYTTNKKVSFKAISIEKESVVQALEFSYNMVFGSGFHRGYRTGGQYSRKKGELFCNTFQGKLAEIVVYNLLNKENVNCGAVDFSIHGEGIWDDSDLVVNGKSVNIKSAAHFSNLLLLETKDWDYLGRYIPNLDSKANSKYDYFILVRIEPDVKKLFKEENIMFSNEIGRDKLEGLILKLNWNYDIVGYINHDQLLKMIQEKYILPQNALLNGKVKMDAENFYIQAGDMAAISLLIKELKRLQEN